MSEVDYDIEQLYIEGYSPRSISALLNCPIEMVYDWLEDNNVNDIDVAEIQQELD